MFEILMATFQTLAVFWTTVTCTDAQKAKPDQLL
jgi:hypothetical protein